MLEHEWRQGPVEDGAVRYELTDDGGATVLTFVHRGLSVGNAKGYIPGHTRVPYRLEAHIAGDHLPDWNERYQEVAPAYPAWSEPRA